MAIPTNYRDPGATPGDLAKKAQHRAFFMYNNSII